METQLNTIKKSKLTRVLCPKCDRVFSVFITDDVLEDIDNYPFTIVLMHSANSEDKRDVHTLIAYIDKQLFCRHVNLLLGKKLFITPYILYNPQLLSLSCNKNLIKYNLNENEEIIF